MKVYLVLQANGELKRKRKSMEPGSAYHTLASAKNVARDDGDSVLEVSIDLNDENLAAYASVVFIRKKLL
jgi:hypothetical protein